jgi:hypothetical protein
MSVQHPLRAQARIPFTLDALLAAKRAVRKADGDLLKEIRKRHDQAITPEDNLVFKLLNRAENGLVDLIAAKKHLDFSGMRHEKDMLEAETDGA